MKKKYSKPIIKVELFQLDASIAASCSSQGFIAISYNENECGIGQTNTPNKQWAYFNWENCDEDVVTDDRDPNDGICYQGPRDDGGIIFVWS